jgi:hypothetical protein
VQILLAAKKVNGPLNLLIIIQNGSLKMVRRTGKLKVIALLITSLLMAVIHVHGNKATLVAVA